VAPCGGCQVTGLNKDNAFIAASEQLVGDINTVCGLMSTASMLYRSRKVYDFAVDAMDRGTVRRALDANVVIISLPGEFAAQEAKNALERGMNVFMFSDNVPIEEEVEMKTIARDKGLFVMGPGCGTAVINNVSLGLMSKVREGCVGIVGASGSGVQEVAVLVHRYGEGVSQAIGTGGRDLSKEVGGITMLDQEFTKEYARRVGVTDLGVAKEAIILNVLTNDKLRYGKEKERLQRFAGLNKVVQLPTEGYSKHLEEFWMLRVSSHYLLLYTACRKRLLSPSALLL
jgi:hypothetical protein